MPGTRGRAGAIASMMQSKKCSLAAAGIDPLINALPPPLPATMSIRPTDHDDVPAHAPARAPDHAPDAQALIRAAAWHEAGHAVLAWRFGKTFEGPGIVVRFDRPGEGKTFTRGTLVLPLARLPADLRPAAQRRLRAECMEFLAGYLAEERALGQRGGRARGADAHRAAMLVMRAQGCIQVVAELHLQVYARATQRLLRRPEVWRAVGLLAERLAAQGRVAPGEAVALLTGSGLKPVQPRYFAAGTPPIRGAAR